MSSLNSHTQTKYTKLDDVTAKDSFMKNPDLMALTFSHLKNDPDLVTMTFSHLKNDYQCLFKVALTCKDFLDVALDALWKELNSLVPLLKLLPALQIEDGAYVCSNNVHVSLHMTLFCL